MVVGLAHRDDSMYLLWIMHGLIGLNFEIRFISNMPTDLSMKESAKGRKSPGFHHVFFYIYIYIYNMVHYYQL